MVNLCPSIWLTNTQILHFLKGCYFVMGGSVDMNDGRFGFSKSTVCSFSQNIAKVIQIWMPKWVKIQQLLKNIQVVLVFSI